MKLWKLIFGSLLTGVLFMQPSVAGAGGGNVIEIVTFRLKPGVSADQFAPIDKAVERDHVSRQPGFISRESAHAGNEWLVIVHWRSAKDADASMSTFAKATAAASFMARIDESTMSMKRYQGVELPNTSSKDR